MKYKIKIHNNFLQEFQKIVQDSYNLSLNIKKFYKILVEKLLYLQIFPYMYPKLIQNQIYRKIIVQKYIILYIVRGNKIILKHIIHYQSNFFNNQD